MEFRDSSIYHYDYDEYTFTVGADLKLLWWAANVGRFLNNISKRNTIVDFSDNGYLYSYDSVSKTSLFVLQTKKESKRLVTFGS